MRKLIILILSIIIFSPVIYAKNTKLYYAHQLCDLPEYECIKIKSYTTWQKLFPNHQERDVVQRVNRTNMNLRSGTVIAVPRNLKETSIWDVSPFPRYIDSTGGKLIVVNQDKLAWGAYDEAGELQWWGPISSGKDYCRDVKRKCNTISGTFYVFSKDNAACESTKFPVGRGGAKMPYCMFFHKGYALHGSHEVPGYRDSHGCVRLFRKDAKWLNENFINIPPQSEYHGRTKVIIQDLDT